MKKTTLVALVFGAFLASCSDNGKQVEASEAQAVETVETETTVVYKTVEASSFLDWRASHMGGVESRFGKISVKSAEVLVNNGQVSNASIVIDMNTLTVESFGDDVESTEKLTGHLKAPDLFNIEVYPTAKFEMTNIEAGSGEYNSVVTGNLTILESTKSITFNANITVTDNEVTVVSEDFAVVRQDWGIIYHTEGDEGVPAEYIIANDIGFTINVTISK